MTVGKKMHEVIGMLEDGSGGTSDLCSVNRQRQAKQMFTSSSQQLDQVVDQLSSRVKEIEAEEPQHSMSCMAQQVVQKQQAQQQSQQEKHHTTRT